jgi:hypothetical protein
VVHIKLKKINSTWIPSEQKDLQVGETIDFGGDPRNLIIEGNAVGIGEDGEELGPLELYGVVTEKDIEEIKEYRRLKYQKNLKKTLEIENAILKAEKDKLETKPKKANKPQKKSK